MRIGIASDLHAEFIREEGHSSAQIKQYLDTALPSSDDIDVMIIAGDLCTVREMRSIWKYLSDRFTGKEIIAVLGNHEFYNSDVATATSLATEISIEMDNIHILQNETFKVGDQMFHGTSLWFPDLSQTSQAFFRNANRLNDFRCIGGFRDWFSQANTDAVEFLNGNVSKESIVITHHAPSHKSVQPQWRGNAMNDFYVTEMCKSPAVEAEPKLWIHGHMHGNNDYEIHKTRVICNPHGYPDYEENPGYTKMIVEV